MASDTSPTPQVQSGSVHHIRAQVRRDERDLRQFKAAFSTLTNGFFNAELAETETAPDSEFKEYVLQSLIPFTRKNQKFLERESDTMCEQLQQAIAELKLDYDVTFGLTKAEEGMVFSLILSDPYERNPHYQGASHDEEHADEDTTEKTQLIDSELLPPQGPVPIDAQVDNIKDELPELIPYILKALGTQQVFNRLQDFGTTPETNDAQHVYTQVCKTIQALQGGQSEDPSNGEAASDDDVRIYINLSETGLTSEELEEGLLMLQDITQRITDPHASEYRLFETGEILEHNPSEEDSSLAPDEVAVTFPHADSPHELLDFFDEHMNQIRTELRATIFDVNASIAQTSH